MGIDVPREFAVFEISPSWLVIFFVIHVEYVLAQVADIGPLAARDESLPAVFFVQYQSVNALNRFIDSSIRFFKERHDFYVLVHGQNDCKV